MTKEEYRKHCEEQIEKCIRLHDIKHLREQVEYLKSDEYLKQLKFERDMLQDLVDEEKLSTEIYDIKKITCYNTELIEKLQQRNNVINNTIKYVGSLSSRGRDCMIYADIKKNILNILNKCNNKQS